MKEVLQSAKELGCGDPASICSLSRQGINDQPPSSEPCCVTLDQVQCDQRSKKRKSPWLGILHYLKCLCL